VQTPVALQTGLLQLPSVPWVGLPMLVKVRLLPSGSCPARVTVTPVSSFVVTDTSKATGVLLSEPATSVVCVSSGTLKVRPVPSLALWLFSVAV
jgi:hypothetical protein